MFKRLVLAAAAVLTLAACEDPRTYRPITSTDLRTFNVQKDHYIQLALLLKTNNVQLPELSMPIPHVSRPGVNLANLVLRPSGRPGLSELLVNVNVSAAAGLEGASPTLPNGTAIPVGGVDMKQLVAIPLDQFNLGGRIYLAIDTVNNTAILGVALTWDALDAFGQTVGELNYFPLFDVAAGVKGIAGIFGSRTPGLNGVAVFADASQLLANSRGAHFNQPVGQVIFLNSLD